MTYTTTSSKVTYQYTINSTVDDTLLGRYVFFKSSTTNPLCSGQDVRVRASDTNWKFKIAHRQNASYAYKRTWQTCSIGLATCITKQVVSPTRQILGYCAARSLSGQITNYSGFSTSARALDQATRSFRNKVARQTGAEKGLQPLIENVKDMRQNIRSSTQLTINLMENLITLKSKRRGLRTSKQVAKLLKDAGQAWLTWGFGISPMIEDAKKIAKSINEFLHRSDHATVLSATASDRFVSSHTATETGSIGAPLTLAHSVSHDVSYKFKGGFTFKVSASNDYTAADHFHFNSGMIIPTAWELLPFSWVIDYFSTVGSFLEDQFIVLPNSMIYLDLTRKYRAQAFVSTQYKLSANNSFVSHNPCISRYEYGEFERTPQSSLPVSSLRVLSLDEAGRYGLTKLLNLTSIAAGGLDAHPDTRYSRRGRQY